MGHVAIFPLVAIRHLHKPWLSLLATIFQIRRKPRMIYNFSWSIPNKLPIAAPHKYSMRFYKALHRLFDCILSAEPALGATYLCKVDLADAYMFIRYYQKTPPPAAFLIAKETAQQEQIVGFHLSIPMGYMEFTSFFYTAKETVKDRELATIDSRSQEPPNLLETLSESIPEDESNNFPTTDNT